MTNILIIGAGRSSTSLINYLIQNSATFNFKITVADVDINLAKEKVANRTNATAISFNINDVEKRREIIQQHDFVISMLPAFMHIEIANDCVEFGKHIATASYVSAGMKALDQEAKKKGLILLNECGLDPGIDHASAMKEINTIKQNGGEVISFKSYCGGLVAAESNDNPWGYKFSWNPRNVVLAGQGTAQYLENGALKFLPYNRLFSQTETIFIEGYGNFDAYSNRDSILYQDIYGLQTAKTMLRGTLRQQHYCKAWNVFVLLGLTDDTTKITHANKLTYAELLNAFLPNGVGGELKHKLKTFLNNNWDKEIETMLDYLELFSDKKITFSEGTPAQLLQALLEEKWKLQDTDKDMIVMQHQFEFTLPSNTNKLLKTNSSLVVIGKNNHDTAMAQTVGLPLAITVKNFITKKFNSTGVQIPTTPQIYEPLLQELEEYNIIFKTQHFN
jgi:saccharopine dehydrogenase-like NADP-dependent oxidoreductase